MKCPEMYRIYIEKVSQMDESALTSWIIGMSLQNQRTVAKMPETVRQDVL